MDGESAARSGKTVARQPQRQNMPWIDRIDRDERETGTTGDMS